MTDQGKPTAATNETADDAAAKLSEKVVRKLDLLIEDAFDLARSENDLDLINKTINALANVRGKLAPPPKNENIWPTLNFAFVSLPGQQLPVPVAHRVEPEKLVDLAEQEDVAPPAPLEVIELVPSEPKTE